MEKALLMQISIKTRKKTELINVTAEIEKILAEREVTNGFCFLYVPHTTAGITINEKIDPAVRSDMLMVLNQIVPWKAEYGHLEGNSPAHIKSSIIGVSKWVAIENSRLLLGTWQGIFFCEFDGPRDRLVHVKIIAT